MKTNNRIYDIYEKAYSKAKTGEWIVEFRLQHSTNGYVDQEFVLIQKDLTQLKEQLIESDCSLANVYALLELTSPEKEILDRWIDSHTGYTLKIDLHPIEAKKKRQNQHLTWGSLLLIHILQANNCFNKQRKMATQAIVGKLHAYGLDADTRSIQYYKNAINEGGTTLIHSDKGRYSGYWLDHAFNLPSFQLDESEIEALNEARDFSIRERSVKDENALVRGFDKIFHQIYAKENNANERGTIYYYVPYHIRWDELKSILDRIQTAIRESRWIEFEYRKRDAKSTEHKIVKPYRILYTDDSFYLIAQGSEDPIYRKYLLDPYRFQNLKETNRTFLYDEDFQTKKELGEFGLYHQDSMIYTIAIKKRFLPVFFGMHIGKPLNEKGEETSEWSALEEESLTISQRFQEEWIVFRFRRDNKQVFINQLFEMRENAILLEPKDIVDEVKTIIDRLYIYYG